MASLLGTSSGLAIGKDRTIQWHWGTGTSRLESYLVMMEGSSQAWRARLQKGSQVLQAWGPHRGGTSPLTARGTEGSEERPRGGEGGAGAKGF